MHTKTTLSKVEALIFDVFGTVVNWRDSIIAEVAKAAADHRMPEGDWGRFADEWRAWYGKSTRELSSGDGPWRLVDEIHREKLDVLLDEYGLSDMMSEESKQHLNRAWHRLDGWPDSPSGPATLEVEIHHCHRIQRKSRVARQYGKTRRSAVGCCNVARCLRRVQTIAKGLPKRI